jgi:hypothetical protein
MYEYLSFLETLESRLENIDNNTMLDIIGFMPSKAVPVAKFHPGHVIDRVYIHKADETDFRAANISRLSYNTYEPALLKQKEENQYGRANLPGEGLFYGALTTPEIKINRATAFAETTRMGVDKTIKEEYFTVSRWIIQKEFFGCELVFSDNPNVSEMVKRAQVIQSGFLDKLELPPGVTKDDVINQLRFFSNQFRKTVSPDRNFEYKISAALAYIILNYPWRKLRQEALTYPSVKTDGMGQNIVLTHNGVKFLKFDKAVVMKAERTANGVSITKSFDMAVGCDKFGNLTWQGHADNLKNKIFRLLNLAFLFLAILGEIKKQPVLDRFFITTLCEP